jgi:hypothetical protein
MLIQSSCILLYWMKYSTLYFITWTTNWDIITLFTFVQMAIQLNASLTNSFKPYPLGVFFADMIPNALIFHFLNALCSCPIFFNHLHNYFNVIWLIPVILLCISLTLLKNCYSIFSYICLWLWLCSMERLMVLFYFAIYAVELL